MGSFGCRPILIIVNLVFSLLGLGIWVVGGLLIWNRQLMRYLVRDALFPLLEVIGRKNDAKLVNDVSTFMLVYTTPLGEALFYVGLVLLVLSAIGFIGACGNNKILLFIFASVLVLKAFAIFVLVIYFYSSPAQLTVHLKPIFFETLRNYESLKGVNIHSLFGNIIMIMFKCCGGSDGRDFHGSTRFSETLDNSTDSRRKFSLLLDYPYVCCKLKHDLKTQHTSCPKRFTAENSNINFGCWSSMESSMVRACARATYVAMVLMVVELILACLALYTAAFS